MSPWCEVISLLKFAFITSSIGSIGTTAAHTNVLTKCNLLICLSKLIVLVSGSCFQSVTARGNLLHQETGIFQNKTGGAEVTVTIIHS